MARRLILQNLMKLAQSIRANPKNFMGTKTNISFLGKGPTRNPLFQGPLSIESATEAQMGSREGVIGAVEDAMAYATANKLNSIQIQALGLNLQGIKKMFNPPVLPSATVSQLPTRGTGIRSVLPQATEGERLYNKLTGLNKPRLVGTPQPLPSFLQGPAAITKALDQKTGMSRAIARQILQQDTRIKLKPEELWKMKLGEGEPLDLMKKYYGRSMLNLDAWLDDFLPTTNLPPRDLATRVLAEVELIPQFAKGGLAGILEV